MRGLIESIMVIWVSRLSSQHSGLRRSQCEPKGQEGVKAAAWCCLFFSTHRLMLRFIEHQTQNANSSASLIAHAHRGDCALDWSRTESEKKEEKQGFIFQFYLIFLWNFFSILLLSSCGEVSVDGVTWQAQKVNWSVICSCFTSKQCSLFLMGDFVNVSVVSNYT